jgi:hypothetical protein
MLSGALFLLGLASREWVVFIKDTPIWGAKLDRAP